MSIIQKKYKEGSTLLNKLKFAPTMGSGHPGKPPLITKNIPTENTPTVQPITEVQRRADDLTRIAKLFSRKEGLGLLANNTALGIAVDQSYTVKGSLKDKFTALLDIDRFSALKNTLGTLGSTLAQVPLTGTGTHFIKGKVFGQPNSNFNTLSSTTKRLGEPGKVVIKYGRDKYYETPTGSTVGIDKVNFTGPYSATEPKDRADDYIKFFFEILKPGEQNNTFIHLRAFLDSFDDNYTSTWNPLNYVGRGEQLYTYLNFNRNINISFKTAVATKLELQPVYKKLVYLASTTAPSYSDNGVMRGTIVRLNIGDYLSDTPGFFTSVTYGWETRYPFEIGLGKKDPLAPQGGNNTDLKTQELPHVLNCTLSFTPIHTFVPQTGLQHYITNPVDNESQFFPVVEKPETTETQQQNLDSALGTPGFGALGSGF